MEYAPALQLVTNDRADPELMAWRDEHFAGRYRWQCRETGLGRALILPADRELIAGGLQRIISFLSRSAIELSERELCESWRGRVDIALEWFSHYEENSDWFWCHFFDQLLLALPNTTLPLPKQNIDRLTGAAIVERLGPQAIEALILPVNRLGGAYDDDERIDGGMHDMADQDALMRALIQAGICLPVEPLDVQAEGLLPVEYETRLLQQLVWTVFEPINPQVIYWLRNGALDFFWLFEEILAHGRALEELPRHRTFSLWRETGELPDKC